MARDLRTVHLQTEVNEIRWQRHKVEIIATTPFGRRSFSVARVIVTVPLGVLGAQPSARGAIQFTPPLPALKFAVAGLEMGHVAKLIISFKERFWDSLGSFGFVLGLDQELSTWWTQAPLQSKFTYRLDRRTGRTEAGGSIRGTTSRPRDRGSAQSV